MPFSIRLQPGEHELLYSHGGRKYIPTRAQGTRTLLALTEGLGRVTVTTTRL